MLRKAALGTGSIFLLLMLNANAAQVGIVVKFPGSVYTECVEVAEGTDGYRLMEAATLDVVWDVDPQWGHALCKINDIGCPDSNCFCGGEEYWGFYLNSQYSPVGMDGGNMCWNRDTASFSGHYCAQDGDVVGWRWGAYDVRPPAISFDEICAGDEDETEPEEKLKKFRFSILPEKIFAGDNITLIVDDEVEGADLGVYKGIAGMSEKIFSGKTGENGIVSFSIGTSGTYEALLERDKYKYAEFEIEVLKKPAAKEALVFAENKTASDENGTGNLVVNGPRNQTVAFDSANSKLRENEIQAKIGRCIKAAQAFSKGIYAWFIFSASGSP